MTNEIQKHNICILIPVHNEGQLLETLLQDLKKVTDLDVIVIDDGSKDGSGDIARRYVKEVIVNENRSGKGASLKNGFQYAMDQKYDGVLTMDGDGQHLPSDVNNFISFDQMSSSCVVAGNRMNGAKGMPFVRFWVNRFMSGLISLACGKSIPDTQCGFRYIGLDILRAIELSSNDFEIETEILMKACKKNFQVYSVDVTTVYNEEESKISPVKDTIQFFVYFFREIFSK